MIDVVLYDFLWPKETTKRTDFVAVLLTPWTTGVAQRSQYATAADLRALADLIDHANGGQTS